MPPIEEPVDSGQNMVDTRPAGIRDSTETTHASPGGEEQPRKRVRVLQYSRSDLLI